MGSIYDIAMKIKYSGRCVAAKDEDEVAIRSDVGTEIIVTKDDKLKLVYKLIDEPFKYEVIDEYNTCKEFPEFIRRKSVCKKYGYELVIDMENKNASLKYENVHTNCTIARKKNGEYKITGSEIGELVYRRKEAIKSELDSIIENIGYVDFTCISIKNGINEIVIGDNGIVNISFEDEEIQDKVFSELAEKYKTVGTSVIRDNKLKLFYKDERGYNISTLYTVDESYSKLIQKEIQMEKAKILLDLEKSSATVEDKSVCAKYEIKQLENDSYKINAQQMGIHNFIDKQIIKHELEIIEDGREAFYADTIMYAVASGSSGVRFDDIGEIHIYNTQPEKNKDMTDKFKDFEIIKQAEIQVENDIDGLEIEK